LSPVPEQRLAARLRAFPCLRTQPQSLTNTRRGKAVSRLPDWWWAGSFLPGGSLHAWQHPPPPPPPCAHVVEHGPGVQVPEEDERFQLVLIVAVDPRPDPYGRPHGRGGVAIPAPPPRVRKRGEASSCPPPLTPPSKPMRPPIALRAPTRTRKGVFGNGGGGVRLGGGGVRRFGGPAVVLERRGIDCRTARQSPMDRGME